MSFLSGLKSVLAKLGTVMKNALGEAVINGLTDQIVELAKKLVKDAGSRALNNDQKREMVVLALKNKGIPESIARLAVELAYQALKKELATL